MQVNPTNNSGFVSGIRGWHAARDINRELEGDAFARTDSLNRALQQVPEVREAEVARGKELVQQATYPPAETMRRIANLLALKLDREEA